ncbi:hypothetical protein LCGC14_0658270, partial [marine sediment metagenome]
MRLQKTSGGIRVILDKPDDFFDGWLKQGISELGINEWDIRYVISRGDIYYDLGHAFREIKASVGAFDSDFNTEIEKFCPGIGGDQLKDLMKKFSGEAS